MYVLVKPNPFWSAVAGPAVTWDQLARPRHVDNIYPSKSQQSDVLHQLAVISDSMDIDPQDANTDDPTRQHVSGVNAGKSLFPDEPCGWKTSRETLERFKICIYLQTFQLWPMFSIPLSAGSLRSLIFLNIDDLDDRKAFQSLEGPGKHQVGTDILISPSGSS